MLEALTLASTNPQYDKRLFIDLPVQYMKTTSSEHVVYIIFVVFVLTFSGVESNNISQKRTKEYTITTFLHRIELGNRLFSFAAIPK